LVWTTTPWTLVSNVAAAIHPELEYGEWQHDDRRYIAAAALAERLRIRGRPLTEGRRVGTLRGRDLIGTRYVRPLDVVDLPADGKSQVVVAAEFVSAEEGTGIVHLAPAFGADDYAVAREYGLVFVNPVAADGTFQGTRWPALNGRLVTDPETNRAIIERLKELGSWAETRPHTHTYPFCWRCDSPLIYYARDSWFVRTTAIRDRLVEENAQVNWHPPEVGAGRFGEWLANNVDWALSRDRFWGTPLNVWQCDRQPEHADVIGSFAELAERMPEGRVSDLLKRGEFDPHKPSIDGYTWRCRSCAGTMRRVPEVIDAWFDSGAMPYAQWHYPFEHESEFRAHFPADFICEGVDQTRGWFYSLLAIGVGAFDRAPYKHVVVNELVLDAQGQKMSKSRGNVVDPWDVIGRYGADAVRLYLLGQSAVWMPKRFDAEQVGELAGGFLNTLRNTYEFFALYAHGWTPAAEAVPPASARTPSDRWILARLDETVAAVREAWNGYDVTAGTRGIISFVEDLSNWYVRVNRARFWAPDRTPEPAALATLHETLLTVSRLLAPAAPFVSDWLHRALAGTSVHLAAFPVDGGRREHALVAAMDATRRLASLARAAREAGNLRVRQPVARMRVAVPGAVNGPVFASLLDVLRAEVNAKLVEIVHSDDELVTPRGKANFRTLGKRYGAQTPRAAAAVSQLTAVQLHALENGGSVRSGEFEFLPEDVTVTRDVRSDWLVQADGPYVVALDPTLSGELVQEGLAREVVNRVQRLRKEADYDYTTRIELSVSGAADVVAAAEAHRAFIEGETLARNTVLGAELQQPDIRREVEIEGRSVTIALRRYDGRKGGSR
jgi:isoleucyl-tRNA synthetase